MKTFVVKCTMQTPKKKQVVERRKQELKNIFKSFKDISSSEIQRTKTLYQDHISFFQPEPEKPEPIQPDIVDDSFFNKVR